MLLPAKVLCPGDLAHTEEVLKTHCAKLRYSFDGIRKFKRRNRCYTWVLLKTSLDARWSLCIGCSLPVFTLITHLYLGISGSWLRKGSQDQEAEFCWRPHLSWPWSFRRGLNSSFFEMGVFGLSKEDKTQIQTTQKPWTDSYHALC